MISGKVKIERMCDVRTPLLEYATTTSMKSQKDQRLLYGQQSLRNLSSLIVLDIIPHAEQRLTSTHIIHHLFHPRLHHIPKPRHHKRGHKAGRTLHSQVHLVKLA